MSERRKLPRGTQRQIIQYQPVIDSLGQTGVYCIDQGVMRVLRYLAGTRGMWRTSYAIDYDNDHYFIPDEVEFDPIDAAISEFLKEDSMCNDLTDAINNLSSIVSTAGGCCGQGSGGVDPETPFSEFTDDGESYPDGFDSFEEYQTSKCNAAQWFINSWIQDLSFVSTLNFTTASAGTLALTLLVPGINVYVLIGLILFIVSSGLLSVVTSGIVDWIEANNADILCVIFNSVDAENASIALSALVEASSLDLMEQQLALSWISPAAMNTAFEYGNTPNVDADCAECEPCPPIFMALGVFDDVDTFTSALHPTIATHMSQVLFNYDGVAFCGPTVQINDVTLNYGAPSDGIGAFAYSFREPDNTVIYEGASLPSFPVNGVGRLYIRDNVAPLTEHQVTVDWSNE